MSVVTGGGNFNPDKAFLRGQLRPEENIDRKYKEVEYSINDKVMTVWSQTAVDLDRMNTLIVNNQKVMVENEKPGTEEKISPEEVLESIYKAAEDDHFVAHGMANLLQQGVLTKMYLSMVSEKKLQDQDGIMKSNVKMDKQVRFLETNKKSATFKIVQEQLFKRFDTETPEKNTFFKMRTTISGKLDALRAQDESGLELKAAYTKEYAKAEDAKKATYGWFDYESPLKNV